MPASSVLLEVLDGPAAGRTFSYRGQDTFLLGRSESAQLCLSHDAHLSRNHFVIEIDPPHCVVQDLHSANGTFVNGERVDARQLVDGDTISGGQTRIRVRIETTADNPLAATQVISDEMSRLSQTLVMEPPPRRVREYVLQEQIGSGSMGVVYRAIHQESGEPVAVKLISPALPADEQAVRSFAREAAVLESLDHRRIVRFIGTGTEAGHLFLIMEYVPSIDLMQALSRMSLAVRVRVACGIIRQVLDGLQYAHGCGIVHRDIKPKNILVAQAGNALRAKLADFGLARNFLQAGLTRFSSGNEIKGTLSFMAPEQFEGSRYATPASDLFSMTATLYTLICGRLIYEDGDHSRTVEEILAAGPVPLDDRVAGLPSAVGDLIRRGLARSPADRFRSAGEMRELLTPLAGK